MYIILVSFFVIFFIFYINIELLVSNMFIIMGGFSNDFGI